jgi:hypothetical protein
MQNKIFLFTFFNKTSKESENLEVKAVSFADAMPTANIFRHTLRTRSSTSNWDIVSAKDLTHEQSEN